MYEFGDRSRKHRDTCHPDLILVLDMSIKHVELDFTVLCGHREKAAQAEAFATGNSHVEWPFGKHNRWPSDAFDVAPWPIDWHDKEAFAYLAGHIMCCASTLGIDLRWGHDWDEDGDLHDNTLVDSPHFERVAPEPTRIA